MARLRNITITVDDRCSALRADRSGQTRHPVCLAGSEMAEEENYEKAMKRALRRKPFGKSGGKYLTREETHDRAGLRC